MERNFGAGEKLAEKDPAVHVRVNSLYENDRYVPIIDRYLLFGTSCRIAFGCFDLK